MSKNDTVVRELLAKVEEQKKNLGAKPRGTWVTNGIFKRDSQSCFNINTVTDFAKLAEALGFLMVQHDYFNKACLLLKLPATTFRWDGYTVDEWRDDFEMRKDIVEYGERKKTLDATTAKLKGLMSEEARTESELEASKASRGL